MSNSRDKPALAIGLRGLVPLLLLCLSGCVAPPPARPVPGGTPADFPVSGYRISADDEIDVPVTVITDDQGLRVSGAFDISQRRFGIEPFSVMGGALAVADTLELRFPIQARRWRGKGASLSGGG